MDEQSLREGIVLGSELDMKTEPPAEYWQFTHTTPHRSLLCSYNKNAVWPQDYHGIAPLNRRVLGDPVLFTWT
jgi:hypothetical protein